MMTMRASSRLAAGLLALLGPTLAFAAPAVRDLAGGPAVNQIDLHPPMSPIAIARARVRTPKLGTICLSLGNNA